MKKVILLTGASGFIGRELYSKLNKFNCYGIFFKKKINTKHKLIRLDLRNVKKLKSTLLKIKPNIVIHLAGMRDPKLNDKYPLRSKELNLKITKNLVNNLSYKTHFIFFSSDKVYKGDKRIYTETSRTHPLGFYGKYKLNCESLIRKKFKKHHILRIPLVHFNGLDRNFSIIDRSIFLLKKK